MLKDQVISVTDLRMKTKECLDNIDKEPKFVFVNNRPVAVLMDINAYEELRFHELRELKNPSAEILKKAAKAKRTPKSRLHNL